MDVNIDLCTIFNQMPEKKQREIATKLVRDQLYGTQLRTIVVGPEINEDGTIDPDSKPTASGLDMKAIVDELGEEKAVDIMISMLKSGGVTTKILDENSINELMEKCKLGNASPEEYAMAGSILHGMVEEDNERNDMNVVITKTMLDLIAFCKDHKHIKMHYNDLIFATFLVILGSMINTKNTPMARFKDATPEQCINVASNVSDDIEKCLRENLFKDNEPNAQFILLGLLQLAQTYVCKMDKDKSSFVDPKIIEKLFGFDKIFKEDEEKSEDEN